MPNTHTHTPGPWTVQGNSDDEDFSGYMIAGPGECYIAEISNLDGQANEADAALIAAAPELLTACELALTKLEAMKDRFGDKWPLDLSPKRAETALKAAIARATQHTKD